MINDDIKILIIDDEVVYTSILSHILSPFYDVYTANGGREGIETALEIVPDIILLDVLMPDISGFDVYGEIRKHEATENTPVIFITGLNSTADEERGFFLGAVDYITKPFYNSIVLARVKTHVQIVKYIRTIEHLCMIDTLTNLSNRRGFDQRLALEWERSVRSKEPISLLLIDIDKFKHYNDTYGHPFGDRLIQAAAEVFTETLSRSTDFAARWGGDEFAVLLPNTCFAGACKIAEKLRLNIAQTNVPNSNGENISLTISIGVNSITPEKCDTLDDFLLKADKALYTAKKLGRNRFSHYMDDDSPDEQPAISPQPQKIEKTRKTAPASESSVETDKTDKIDFPVLMAAIKNIPLLDVDSALAALGGSVELYIKIVNLIYRSIPQYSSQMESYLFQSPDIRAFSIKIHGLKGSLNQIGYKELGKLAERLELTAKSGDLAHCRKLYGGFQTRLQKLYENLNFVFSKDGAPAPSSDGDSDSVALILERAVAAAEDFDNILAAEILEPLTKRGFPLIEQAVSALEAFQPQNALEYIEEFKKNL